MIRHRILLFCIIAQFFVIVKNPAQKASAGEKKSAISPLRRLSRRLFIVAGEVVRSREADRLRRLGDAHAPAFEQGDGFDDPKFEKIAVQGLSECAAELRADIVRVKMEVLRHGLVRDRLIVIFLQVVGDRVGIEVARLPPIRFRDEFREQKRQFRVGGEF